jgi:hypothetical protein
MNFTIDTRYQQAVQNFAWPNQEDSAALPIAQMQFNQLVQEVAQKIIAASQIRSKFSLPSLSDTFLLVTQDQDKKYGKDTPAKIEQASEKEKTILSHTFQALKKVFEQVTESDLKIAALVFGIYRIHDLATEKIVPLSELHSQIEQMEKSLAELTTMRSRYSEDLIAKAPEQVKQFIANVDRAIAEQSQKLALLKEAANQNQDIA